MSDKHGDVDFGAITAAQKEIWGKGDFHQIARQNVCIAEALCEAVDPHAGDRVLDIACDSGTAALVAARDMLRVCRPSGKIGLATPVPEGWSGDFSHKCQAHAASPGGQPSAALGNRLRAC